MSDPVVWLRLFNLATSMMLLSTLLYAAVKRWQTMRPDERLFALGLNSYVIYVSASTVRAIVIEAEMYWWTPLLAIANIWLIVASIFIFRHPRGLSFAEPSVSGRVRVRAIGIPWPYRNKAARNKPGASEETI